MGKDVASQIGHHPLADRDDEVVTHGAGKRENRCDHQEHGEIVIDEAGVGIEEAVVDHAPHGERKGKGGGSGQKQCRDGAAEQSAILQDIGKQSCKRSEGPHSAGAVKVAFRH